MYGGIAIRWGEMTTVVVMTKIHCQRRLAIECLLSLVMCEYDPKGEGEEE